MKTILSLYALYHSTSAQGPMITPINNIPPPPSGKQYGAFWQLCDIPTPGQSVCQTTSDLAIADGRTQGILDCSKSYDCCMCKGLQCGSINDPSCSLLKIGPNSAFGVKDIRIMGDQTHGAIIECAGSAACANSVMHGAYVSEIKCGADFACQNSIITVNEPIADFSVDCSMPGSCEGAMITVNIAGNGQYCNPASVGTILLSGIQCGRSGACTNMRFTVNNNGCDKVIIESLECFYGACGGASFALNGNVEIATCELPGSGPQPVGVSACFDKLASVSCFDASSCMNQVRTVTDPVNGFELLCEGQSACLGSLYTFDITPAYTTTEAAIALGSVCSASNSCKNTRVVVNNRNSLPVVMEVLCFGVGACENSVFVSSGSVDFVVECTDHKFCNGCILNGAPCEVVV